MNATKSNLTNTVLMTIVGLLVGVIGGYLYGRSENPATPTTSAAVQTATSNCPHELAPGNAYILAGFRCPGTDDTQTALLSCHCATAHGLKDRVKSMLAAGQSGEDIRNVLMLEYGDRLKFAGQ